MLLCFKQGLAVRGSGELDKKKIYRIKKSYSRIFVVFLISFLIGAMLFLYTTRTLDHVVKQNMSKITEMGAMVVAEDTSSKFELLSFIQSKYYVNHQFSYQKMYEDDAFHVLRQKGFKEVYYISPSGKLYGRGVQDTGKKYSEYLSTVRKVVAPFYDFKDESLSVAYVLPVNEGWKFKGTLILSYDILTLSQLTDNIRFGERGNTFIVNKEGITVAHDDRRMVYLQDNQLKDGENTGDIEGLSPILIHMIGAETGTGVYYYEGLKKFIGYAPVSETDWAIGIAIPYIDIFDNVEKMIKFMLLGLLIFILAIYFLNLYLKRAQTRLEKEQKLSHDAIQVAHIMIVSFDKEGVILEANHFAKEKLHLPHNLKEEKPSFFSLVHEDYQQKFINILNRRNEKILVQNFELAHELHNQHECYVLWNFKEDTEGKENGLIEMMGVDITERVQAEKELLESHVELTALYEELTASQEELSYKYDQLRESDERYNLVLDASNIGIWEWNFKDKKRAYSERWRSIFGYEDEEVDTMDKWLKVILGDEAKAYQMEIEHFIQTGKERYEIEYPIIDKEGNRKWIYEVGKALRDSGGDVMRMAGSHADITNLKNYQNMLEKMAYYDVLTELPNRAKLYEVVKAHLIQHEDQPASFLFIDFDNFKVINDILGHTAGDYLLHKIGMRLKEVLSPTQQLFRIGGDEFIVFLSQPEDHQKREAIIKKIFKSLEHAFEVEKSAFYLTISMGVSLYPDNGNTTDELLKNADIAMYYAKDMGKNRYEYFNEAMNVAIVERQRVENAMRTAVSNEEMQLYYQPQISVDTGEIQGFEALIRWKSPDLGFVMPDEFIQIAEDNKQILEIGDFVMDKAFEFAHRVNGLSKKPLQVAVNLSVIQILEEGFLEKVRHYMEKHKVSHESIGFEITESVLISNFDLIEKKLKALRDMGISISLDDFGKGYSSLSYLLKLPIDIMKIDKTFISGKFGMEDKNLVDSLIKLAHSVGLSVIAEGVETERQRDYLIAHHCDSMQGYYFAKPMPEEKALLFLSK